MAAPQGASGGRGIQLGEKERNSRRREQCEKRMGMGEGRADTGRALVASTVGMSCVDSGRRHTGGVESDQGHHTLGKGGRQSLCAGDPTSWTTGTQGEGQHGKQPECRPQTQEWTKGQREGPAPRTVGATGGLVLRRLLRQGGVEPPGPGTSLPGLQGRGGEGQTGSLWVLPAPTQDQRPEPSSPEKPGPPGLSHLTWGTLSLASTVAQFSCPTTLMLTHEGSFPGGFWSGLVAGSPLPERRGCGPPALG